MTLMNYKLISGHFKSPMHFYFQDIMHPILSLNAEMTPPRLEHQSMRCLRPPGKWPVHHQMGCQHPVVQMECQMWGNSRLMQTLMMCLSEKNI